MKIGLVTIRHSGTRFIYRNLKLQDTVSDVALQHMDNYAELMADLAVGKGADMERGTHARGFKEVTDWATMEVSDPRRIAASWANRNRFQGELLPKFEEIWYRSWEQRAQFLEDHPGCMIFNLTDPVQHGFKLDQAVERHSVQDVHGLLPAIEENAMEYFYSIVPERLIEGIQQWLK